MSKKKAASVQPPKRWLFHGILVDQPISEEDSYYSEEQLADIISALRIPGVKFHNFHIQELPSRAKKPLKIDPLGPEKEA